MKEFCVRGHTLAETRKTYPSGFTVCYKCQSIRHYEWVQRHRDRVRAYQRYFYSPKQQRAYRLKVKYGLTAQNYDALLESQEGRCAICGTKDFSRSGVNTHAYVDHDHETGEVRGLLCFACNTGLGAFSDSPEIMLEAIAYLGQAERH